MSDPFQSLISDSSTGVKLREWSSLIGIVTAIVGNILISFALNIQRYAHIRLDRENDQKRWDGIQKKQGYRGYGTQQSEIAEERAHANLNATLQDGHKPNGAGNLNSDSAGERSTHSRSSSESTIKAAEKHQPLAAQKTYLQSPYWWGGIVLMTVGEAGNFLAYGFAPASIVSPLGVVALVSNCIIAPCLLKERFRARDFWGVLVAIAGAVVIVLSAKNSETKMGPDDVWEAITRWEFELYLGITAGMMIILMWASGKYGDRTILIDLGLVALFGKQSSVQHSSFDSDHSTGGYTALSTKGVASLLSDTLWRALTFPITYLLVFILVFTAVMQIRYVNRALQRFDSTQVIPIQFVLFTISVIVGSAILYRDFKSATGDRIAKFIGGCVMTFLGVYLITSGRGRTEGNGIDEELGDEENAIGLVDEERYLDEVDADAENRKRRKSSLSITFDDIPSATDSRRSSKQQAGSGSVSPRTPSRQHSQLSSESSVDSTPSSLENRWRPSDDVNSDTRPRPPESSISTPLLPSDAQRTDSSTPLRGANLSTPSRPSTLSGRSMARLTPGPLTSPLSFSLSAVVADEMRRSSESPSSRRRPRLSGIRKSGSQRATIDSSAETMTGSSPLKVSQLAENAAEGERPSMPDKSPSVAARLGEFFTLKREKSKGKSNDRGENGGGR